MSVAVVALVCVFSILALLILLVHRLRPKKFRLKAAVTKWISLEVELESPEPMNRKFPSTCTDREQKPGSNHTTPG